MKDENNFKAVVLCGGVFVGWVLGFSVILIYLAYIKLVQKGFLNMLVSTKFYGM